jgi:hypothetical protein
MALTQSAWTVKTVNRRMVATCTVAGETGDADLITARTPTDLDPSKPFSIAVYANEDLSASGTAAVDIWGGYSDTCSLATADAGTDCVLVHANSTDIDAGATQVINVFPGIDGTVTQVTNASPGTALIPPFPYYIINVDLSSTLQDAATIAFTITQ